MGANLQVLFFISIIVLQIALITVTVKELKVLQGIMSILEQKASVKKTRGYEEHEIGNKKEGERHVEKEEVENPYRIPEKEELLFIKQVELNREDPIVEVNIVADRKEK